MEKKLKRRISGRWPLNGVGRYIFFFNFEIFFNGVFVRFSTRGVQKHHKKLFAESPCQKLLAEKVEKKNFFPLVFSHRFFLSRFWPFLCMRSPKAPQKHLLKSDQNISKNLKKK
jgi:hypothetical protein